MMAREHFDSSCLCDNPTRTTPQLHPAPWDGEALATAFETMDELDARLRGREMRCWSCGADPEPVLYRVDGNWVCGQCALECPCCAERPAVASARRPADDPTAPNQIDMICAECLRENWSPGETLQGAYLCLECDEWHVREQDCCACHGDGWFDRDEDTEYGAVAVAQHCDCPAGVRLSEQAEREFAWMLPHDPRRFALARDCVSETPKSAS